MNRQKLGVLVFRASLLVAAVGMICRSSIAQSPGGQALPGSVLLSDLTDDPAAQMVAGIDRFALKQIEKAKTQRAGYWNGQADRQQNLDFLKSCLGIPQQRQPLPGASFLYERPNLLSSQALTIAAVRWPVCQNPAPQLQATTTLWGEGLRLEPQLPNRHLAIVLPDADQSPEDYLAMTEQPTGGDCGQQQRLVRQLLDSGFTVVIPQLVSRRVMRHGHAELSQREYLHRAAFELGQTLIGYEVQMVQALLDACPHERTLVCGFGEGGLLALFSGAIDERIDAVACCGYFGPREVMWQHPLSRNLFGLLQRFGDAELAAMIAPRRLLLRAAPSYQVHLETAGGAPANWASPSQLELQAEFSRMQDFAEERLQTDAGFAVLLESGAVNPRLSQQLLKTIATDFQLPLAAVEAADQQPLCSRDDAAPARARQRELRIMASIDAHTQALLVESDYVRAKFMNIGLPRDDLEDRSNALASESVAAYQAAQAPFREIFRQQIIGQFEEALLPPAARTRQNYAGQGWTGYDVLLDVFPDVFAYGILLLPDDMTAGERRPVVVCQHGLEGRPQDIIAGDHYAYHDFAAKLAERGFIVFAPQNPYIGKDDFRTLQRKMNSIGKTLFSVIGPQHQQLLNWLSSLPNVDASRIAFYGLSYGGKSAMRLPALLPQYCLSICSADFNDWVWKNASSRSPYSYVGTGEYEIFEFNLGQTFNYAEMAALIAPRPFMVERGHFDGVAPDDRVAKEFARVRFLYAARLGLPERCEIEWFNGPHTIHGQGTFRFLHQHLNWPEPQSPP